MGTPDDLFRFLLKIATDVPTMTRLSSGDPAQVEDAFDGAGLSEDQKDAIKNGSEANVRAELALAPGFVFNQSGSIAFNQSGFVAEPGPVKKTAKRAAKKTAKKTAKKAAKTSKPAKKAVKKTAKKAAKKSKGRKK